MKRRYLWLLVLPLLAVFVFSAWKLTSEALALKREAAVFASLAAVAETAAPEPIETQPASERDVAPAPTEAVHKRNIAALTAENADCIGWLLIEGTSVNYPVMYTPNEPQKYLRLDFNGEYSHSGVPFLDGRCTPDGQSLIIYGHNMKDDSMFSSLCSYVDPAYFTEHPFLEFETEAGCLRYLICGVALVEPTDEWYDSPVADETTLAELVRHLEEKELYNTQLSPLEGRQLLTLSTCYYAADGDKRLILVATEFSEAY